MKTIGYESFKIEIMDALKTLIGNINKIETHKVKKNNGIELDALTILQKGENSSPSIYLELFYEDYVNGTSLNRVVNDIYDVYVQAKADNPAKEFNEFSYEFEKVKPNIFYKLINLDMNKAILEESPHKKFLDLAITYHCMVNENDNGIVSIRITNEHLISWGVSSEQLIQIAEENTEKMFKPTIRKLDDEILQLISESDDCFDFEFDASRSGDAKMYILTNERKINGASSIIYRDILKKFAQKSNSDIVILPSSIHEVILIPMDKHSDIKFLKDMVREVNDTQVSRAEILSNSVYIYYKEDDKIIAK